ncbi:hypothetical protein, partial [Akkermansia massiliensis]|uniref:hypothetical protein n=1 Tax=Akkermansia massiliensis TaxID=2927224 RepID=UPI003F7C561F
MSKQMRFSVSWRPCRRIPNSVEGEEGGKAGPLFRPGFPWLAVGRGNASIEERNGNMREGREGFEGKKAGYNRAPVRISIESGEWRVESGEWRVESGEWRVESGEWRVESGEWRVES